MYPFILALHVISVLLWIGGVAFVTMIVFPMLSRLDNTLEQVLTFQRIEDRFARLAKLYVLIAGITGFILLYQTGKYQVLLSLKAFHIWFMFGVWLLYALILLFERKFLALFFKDPQKFDVEKVMKRFAGFHWFILLISLLAVFFAVWGSHS